MPELFVLEVMTPVKAIMARICPDTDVEGIVGHSKIQAEIFLVVTLTVDGCMLHSAVCVEFKVPNVFAQQPDARSRTAQRRNSETDQDLQLRRASFPTEEYGDKALCGQLCMYVQNGDEAGMAPAQLCRYFNETWAASADRSATR